MQSVASIWKRIDYFGKASFFFRLLGYLFYGLYLYLFVREYQIPLNIGHVLIYMVGFFIPWLYLYDYARHNNSNRTLIKHLTVDFFLMGFYVGFIHLSYIPSVLFIVCTITSYVASKGYKGAVRFLLFPLGYLFYLVFFDFTLNTDLPTYLDLFAIVYVFIHLNILAFISYRYSRNLHRTKSVVLKQQDEILAQSDELKAVNDSLVQSNTNLEKIVGSRTKELEAKKAKLAEYAFINGHQLRAPVATMLGLINLIAHAENEEERKEITEKLKYEVDLLNLTIKDIRLRLETDELIHDEMEALEESLSRYRKNLNLDDTL
ncbi:MASE2 domain-containing protein [Marivirga atlantica]|uniref:MASE2 domain-containing protein n=1 Tax=Marivirga atlantica TaxID=1548457 RepID=A0A937AF65_9BACT|nr:MASE2 domain-containing protein [Marivirga atlantica]MBL0765601.1 hypothetical protein [Marivirga atlantica]